MKSAFKPSRNPVPKLAQSVESWRDRPIFLAGPGIAVAFAQGGREAAGFAAAALLLGSALVGAAVRPAASRAILALVVALALAAGVDGARATAARLRAEREAWEAREAEERRAATLAAAVGEVDAPDAFAASSGGVAVVVEQCRFMKRPSSFMVALSDLEFRARIHNPSPLPFAAIEVEFTTTVLENPFWMRRPLGAVRARFVRDWRREPAEWLQPGESRELWIAADPWSASVAGEPSIGFDAIDVKKAAGVAYRRPLEPWYASLLEHLRLGTPDQAARAKAAIERAIEARLELHELKAAAAREGLRSAPEVQAIAARPAVASAKAPIEAALRWKLRAGERLRCDISRFLATTVGGQPAGIDVHERYGLDLVASDAPPDGSARLAATFARVRVGLSGEMTAQSDSSVEGPADPAGRLCRSLVGKTFHAALGPVGDVRSVSGFDEVRERVAKELLAGMPPEEKIEAFRKGVTPEQSIEGLLGNYTDEVWMDTLARIWPRLPEGKVREGAEWTQEATTRSMLGLAVTRELSYGLTFLDDGRAARIRAGGAGKFSPEDLAESPDLASVRVTVGLEARWDVERGRPRTVVAKEEWSTIEEGRQVVIKLGVRMDLLDE